MPERDVRGQRLFGQILWGIGAGVLVGLVLGDAVRPLQFVSGAFVRLLQVNVLPYLLGSLIASLGSRPFSEMRVLARSGILFLLLVWALTLLLVLLAPLAFPNFGGVATFGLEEPPQPIDWLDLYIPSNLFRALSNNLIPAVVLFGILTGLALGRMQDDAKETLLKTLLAFNEAMTRVSRMVLALTPYGLFAIAAVSAGEIRLADFLRLQVWFHFYAGGALLLTLWLLPALVSQSTPVHYGRYLLAMRSAIVTAAAAGDALVVLPLIAESAKELLVEQGADQKETDRAVSVAVPLVYNFPHVGKILSLSFLPFAAWYSGSALGPRQLLALVSAGPLSMFGNINAAVPFLLDLLHVPADLFELFTVSAVINTRFGTMAAASHIAALTIVVSAATVGTLQLTTTRLIRLVATTGALVLAFVIGTRALFMWVLPPAPSGLETLSSFELRPPFAQVVAAEDAEDGDQPPQRGQRLAEIKARRLLRVGYFADSVPWAFVNAQGELVGYDIEAAHALATELGVRVQFRRVDNQPPRPSRELLAGRVDILMTGYTASVGRAGRMELSHGYSTEHVGFIVRDFDRRRFESLATLDGGARIVVAVPPIEGAIERVKAMMPDAVTRQYTSVSAVLDDQNVTAVLTSLERAFYWSRVRPEFSAVRPEEVSLGVVVVYAMPDGETDFKDLVDLWIETRQASGDAQSAHDYWVLGKALTRQTPRWSLLRNVLGWR